MYQREMSTDFDEADKNGKIVFLICLGFAKIVKHSFPDMFRFCENSETHHTMNEFLHCRGIVIFLTNSSNRYINKVIGHQ